MATDLDALDRSFRQGFGGAGDCASPAQRRAIGDWFDLYFDRTPTQTEDPCLRLPCLIVSKLCRACFAEYQARARSGFAADCLTALNGVRKKAMQLAMIGGECWLKPVPVAGGIRFTVVRRDMALVLGRGPDGEATALGSASVLRRGGRTFTLMERRSLDPAGQLVIESRLFESSGGPGPGSRVALSALPECADIPPRLVLPPVGGLGLVGLRLSGENCVDGSPDGVSIYAPAADLIRRINQNERQLAQEFELGASRVFASADLIRRRGTARSLPPGLFVGLDDDPDSTGLTIFSPKLREASYLARKAEQLRDLESLIGLKRGLLGPVEAAQRTATEVTSSEGDYALTIRDLQESWQQAAAEAMTLCARLGEIYALPGAAEARDPDLQIEWGDNRLA